MKPNLAQARRTCSSLLDPADDTPVSNWICVPKSIPRSVGIVRPEGQVLVCANAERVVTCGKIDSCSVSARSREICKSLCSPNPRYFFATATLGMDPEYNTPKLGLPDSYILTETPQADQLPPGLHPNFLWLFQ